MDKPPGGEVPFLNALSHLLIKLKKGRSLDWENGKNENIFLARPPSDYVGSRKEHFKNKMRRFYDGFHQNPQEYNTYATSVLKEIEQSVGSNDSDRLIKIVTDYLFYLDENFIGESINIYDNAIPGQNLSFFNYLDTGRIDNLKIFVLDRDPRDQYYEIPKLSVF